MINRQPYYIPAIAKVNEELQNLRKFGWEVYSYNPNSYYNYQQA